MYSNASLHGIIHQKCISCIPLPCKLRVYCVRVACNVFRPRVTKTRYGNDKPLAKTNRERKPAWSVDG